MEKEKAQRDKQTDWDQMEEEKRKLTYRFLKYLKHTTSSHTVTADC